MTPIQDPKPGLTPVTSVPMWSQKQADEIAALRQQLQEAEERAKKAWWNKREHELEDEIAALEEAAAAALSLAESERDAAIERAEKAREVLKNGLAMANTPSTWQRFLNEMWEVLGDG